METPLVVMVLVALLLAQITVQDHLAQECRVYHLIGGKPEYVTPSMPVKNTLAVSFYTKNESDFPRNIHIMLKGDTGKKQIHIRNDGKVSLASLWSSNVTIRPNCVGTNTWITLAILLHDQNIILYWIDDRENYITSNASLGSSITAKVTTKEPSLYVTLNCPAGCLIHDKNSTLIGREILLGDGVTIYLSPEKEEKKPIFALGFKDHEDNHHEFKIDLSKWDSSRWHKAFIAHDKQNHITVYANGVKRGSMKIEEENATITILNTTTALFSLQCYPDHATGLEGWGNPNDTHEHPTEEDDGAGVGEVLAWVLAGMALFLVMVMALFLCTKMSPGTNSVDYAGASIGVIGSFGRQMTFRNAEREAEEDTEPDSPTFLSPIIHHKVPEEEDEHQSNTKML